MAQQHFPYMVSVDWLTVNLFADRPINDIPENDFFIWNIRPYGSKQFSSIFDIEYIDDDGFVEPFGVLLANPTQSSWHPLKCQLKLANHLLYKAGRCLWFDLLQTFLGLFRFAFDGISRVDIAADFIFLEGRVSGSQLVQNIKSFKWWKCGSVNISEHYTMPYSLKWQKAIDDEGIDTEVYLQNGALQARVETLTFGTMSSDAQVCIYDKTLELNRSQVSIMRNGKETKESAKEYIRDCHKESGVYDKARHTWRVEIRLKNKAAYVHDDKFCVPRPLILEDLQPAALPGTFVAAVDKYFRLVDATDNGTQELTGSYVAAMKGHKNRLPIVRIFPASSARISFAKKKYHKPANQFHRSVINRLDQLGDRLKRCPAKISLKGDTDKLSSAQNILPDIERRAKVLRANDASLIANLQRLLERAQQLPPLATSEEISIIREAKEVAERHWNTESPIFVRNMRSLLKKAADKMAPMIDDAAAENHYSFRSVRPSDSQVLIEAADILKAVYTDVAFDERAEAGHSIYEQKLLEAIEIFNSSPMPPAEVLDLIYTYFRSPRFIELHTLEKILSKFCYSQFANFYTMNFRAELYNARYHRQSDLASWSPPHLSRFDYREHLPQLDVRDLSNFQLF